MNTDAWDVFMNVSRDSGVIGAQCFEGPVRIVKCVIYLFFFCVILGSLFASKVSLLALTTGVSDPRKVSRVHTTSQPPPPPVRSVLTFEL